ncbi:MAG: Lsr2 family DNA-binding protein [Propionibacteriaceae bacterium]
MTIRTSDLSGASDAIETRIGLDGNWRAVDLTEEEVESLETLLEPYLRVSRPGSDQPRREVPDTTPEQRVAIRTWALERDHGVKLRGRIPKHVMQAYDEAHGVKRGRRGTR